MHFNAKVSGGSSYIFSAAWKGWRWVGKKKIHDSTTWMREEIMKAATAHN